MYYKLNEANMFMDISDGMAVVINSETGIYYGMNGLGKAVFETLTNPPLPIQRKKPKSGKRRLNSNVK